METIDQCIHLNDLMKVQQKIIINHLDEHKWCNHITDKNAAIIDFIKKYGWVMRETYCEICEFKKDCSVRRKFIKETENVQ